MQPQPYMACLVLCESCQRHVRKSEASCPFCAASLPAHAPCAGPKKLPRVASRAAIVFAGTALACGCFEEPTLSPLYGVAVIDDGGRPVADARPREASTDAPDDDSDVDAAGAGNDADMTDASDAADDGG